MTGDAVYYVPYQGLTDPFRRIAHSEFARAVHLIDTEGQITSGAEAVFRSLALGGAKRWPLWVYRRIPLAAPVAESAYALVAQHRTAASRVTRWLWGSTVVPTGEVLTRWFFIRLMAVVYFIAFVSLGVQILGLVGSNGILPAEQYLNAVRNRFGEGAYAQFPTIAWYSCSDRFLQGLCWSGAAVSVLIFFRIAPALMLLVAWALYLSLYRVGQTFLGFQWDILLLEAGLLSIFFAPWGLFPKLRNERAPTRMSLWLIRWLVFRLMFASGVVKLVDENPADPTWFNLTALTYHFETQCIPNAVAWFAHQLPLWFQKLSVIGVFVIEIVLPFLIFLPRRPRMWSCVGLIFLQLLIILTGNYNFFNILSIALCFVLLDDGYMRRLIPRWISGRRDACPNVRSASVIKRVLTVPVAIVIGVVSTGWMLQDIGRSCDRCDVELFFDYEKYHPRRHDWMKPFTRFGSINSYGLFRSMTTKRPEITIEGSNDRRTWKTYEFKWKPGDLSRRPPFVAPHQPRLDWQMWFAALGDIRSSRNRWFVEFLRKVLEGEKEVLALLETNPFPEAPPRFLRAMLYDYQFTDFETHGDGHWWTRELIRPYSPVLTVNSFRR